jgi:hypothetical protein
MPHALTSSILLSVSVRVPRQAKGLDVSPPDLLKEVVNSIGILMCGLVEQHGDLMCGYGMRVGY